MKSIAEKYINKIIDKIMSHYGSSDPIQVSELMSLVPLTDREIRKVVSYLVTEKLYPIGSKSSHPAGFYRITDFDDFVDALSNLNPRSKKIEKRALKLAQACRNSGIEIPELTVSKYKSHSTISIEIKNSVVFIK